MMTAQMTKGSCSKNSEVYYKGNFKISRLNWGLICSRVHLKCYSYCWIKVLSLTVLEYSNDEQLPVFPTRIMTGTLNLSRSESNDSGISLGSNYITNSADKVKTNFQNRQPKKVTFSRDLQEEDDFRTQRMSLIKNKP